MNYLATITSKNQLTLPIVLFKKAGFRIGQKISVSEDSGRLVLTPAEMLIEELAGSLKMPKKWKGKSLDRIIEESKIEYFKNNKFT